MSEREQWIELAEMLGIKQKTPLAVGMIRVRAMLHGLACLECNGSVFHHTAVSLEETTGWVWESHDLFQQHGYDGEWQGEADTHPNTLLAMLTAHREARP
jgi:hypothetical protein